MDKVDNQPTLSDTIWIGFLCLAINSLLAIFIGLHQPSYFRDSHADWNPDGNHYVQLGENVWSRHVYSRQAEPPYQPDIKWTPIYPVLAGGICLFFKTIWPLYALQVAFSVATALLLYGMTTWMFGRRVGLLAGIIYSSDLMLAILNFEVLSESLYVLLSTTSIFLWARMRFRNGSIRRPLLDPTLIGVVMGLAILIRSAGLYLPLVLAIVELMVSRRSHQHFLLAPTVILTAALLTILPWIARNYAIFGVPRLTIVDSLNLVYYVGAGVYQVEFGIDNIEKAQAKISSDYGLVSASQAHNPWQTAEDIATMQNQWRKAAWEIFVKYPRSLARSAVTGVIVGWIAHNTNDVAQASGTTWSNPGLANLQRMDVPKFIRGLIANHPFLIFVFVWQELMMAGGLILGILGVITTLPDKPHRLICVGLLVIAAYYVCTMAMQGLSPDARMRAPLMPLVCIFTALGIVGIRECLLHPRRKNEIVEALSS